MLVKIKELRRAAALARPVDNHIEGVVGVVAEGAGFAGLLYVVDVHVSLALARIGL